MSIETSKIELVKLILAINNYEFLSKITAFIQEETVDFWDELSENERREIKKGIQELDDNKRVEFKDFIKKIS